jgi:acetolactate synthase-1/2/3 large subunit
VLNTFLVYPVKKLDILNSLVDPQIKLILTRYEQVAGFMAATYGRLTGKA